MVTEPMVAVVDVVVDGPEDRADGGGGGGGGGGGWGGGRALVTLMISSDIVLSSRNSLKLQGERAGGPRRSQVSGGRRGGGELWYWGVGCGGGEDGLKGL